MHTFSKILLAMFMLINIKYGKTQQLSQDPLYKLVFSDEFDSTALNTNKWHTGWPWWDKNGANSNIFGKWCDPNWPNSYGKRPPEDVSNGNRYFDTIGSGYQRIRSKAENYNDSVTVFPSCPSTICTNHSRPCDPWTGYTSCTITDSVEAFQYSTAMLRSKYTFTNGYFEMRYSLTNISNNLYNSYGPDFWVWGGSNNCNDSAAYSEIDFFEERGTDWKMQPNIHYRQWDPSWVSPNATPAAKCKNQNIQTNDTIFWHALGAPVNTHQPYSSNMSGPYNGGTWHTVGCEWTPDYTDFYYDSNDTVRRYSNTVLPIIDNLYNMWIIVDIGIPPSNYCIHDSANTTWPFDYDIDYVKVYQINQDANCTTTSGNFSSFTTNNYTSKLFRDLTVGGSGTAIVNSGSYHFAGQDYVLLQDGFEVSGTATAIISTTKCQPRQSITPNATEPDQSSYQRIINDKKIAIQNNGID
jgi:hypothetical protein